ncbi:Hsp90 co-chaperone Cdc37 [Talaromyces islandicus]|uniref:Hsp90 chaperone protein kinase-targeting subunit n=1 Tax=Talaromyces islandicus TaxID=28573 RepID=A0A0U1LJJ2_TALIS|nr:Hsp90 co-chaperone Cdc37 [Talaromyces islandicus]
MVLDYSKWDAIELSDDSDIEVHPNVDKRSFIRAKQNQIHQQREQRRHDIETLKYERIINDGLLGRIDKLLGALQKHEDSNRDPEEVVFQSLIESAGDPAADQPPAPPAGVHANVKEQPKYSQMMGSLVDQVKKEIDESKSDKSIRAYITGVQGHKDKVLGLQQELLKKLAELEKEESSKITSNDIHTGFDSSYVAKSSPADKAKASSQGTVELLNPSSSTTNVGAQSSGADADVEDEDDEADVKVSDLAKQFAKIPMADYKSTLQFISENPAVVAESETDGLLVEAFNSQMDGKPEYARQCVHHGLLLQYCRSLGRDGVSLFFKRITTKDHQAATLFRNDVNETYNKIKTRAAELAKDRSPENDPAGVEQIQLHAVDPNTQINIVIPSADSTVPEEIEARKIFDTFPPGLQRALQTESLDEVNKVLGKMSVEEAEIIVDKLGQGGMLSLEEGIVDATTEEGRKKLEQIELEGRQEVVEEIGEPTEDQLD